MPYPIIYADPPWQYRVWSHKGQGRSAESHYPTMSATAIAALPVAALAAPDCVLFLWATYPTLPDALLVLSAWGFRYKTVAFVWVKRNPKVPGWHWGMGHWTRANSEVVLLATRGRPRRRSANVHQIIEAPTSGHSQKPAEVRERIVALLGDLPRIDLFARDRVPGWDALGLELDGRRLEESLRLQSAADHSSE